jgi:hypothetical protein
MTTCLDQSLAPIKRGDTLIINGVYKVGGVPESLTGWTVASQVRDRRKTLVETFAILLGDQIIDPGSFSLSAGEINWKAGDYLCDIEFIDPTGFVRSTDTFIIPVLEDITQVVA